MKKLSLIILLLALATPGVLYLVWDTQTRNLGNALIADLSAARPRTIVRTPAPQAPLHENGFQCLGAMLDVTSDDVTSFFGKGTLEEFTTGRRPISELPPEVRERMLALSPWASSMRGCGDSMKLVDVEGLEPWAPSMNARRLRFTAAVPGLVEFTALELRVLLADKQPEVALERCTATWAMVADQSHLGLTGAMYVRMAVRRLAPACGEALAATTPEVRAQLAKQWAPLRTRLALPSELVNLERLQTSLRVFSWVSSEAVRAQLPPVVQPGARDLKRRLRVGRMWRTFDAAMRELSAVADAPGAARASAGGAVEAAFSAMELPSTQYASFLTAYEETFLLLDLFADLAAGGSKPLPPGVTKTPQGLEFDNGQGQKLLIPTGA